MLIPLTEEFNNKLGTYADYDAYEESQRAVLYNQKHTDLRVFQNANVTIAAPISSLNPYTMEYMDTLTMIELQGSFITQYGENWSGDGGWNANSNVGSDPAHNNFRTLRRSLNNTGTHNVYSTLVSDPIDISSYESDDWVSVALPDFPLSALNLANTTLNLGDGSLTVNVPFNASLVSLVQGHSELRLPISAFSTLDLSNIITVGFTFAEAGAHATVDVIVMAVRVLSKDWKSGSVDTDTRYGRLRRNPPRNGDTTTPPEYTNFTLWRSSNPPEQDDPRPIDGSVGVNIKTGSMQSDNSVNIYFRELTEDFMTQIDLDGTPQSDLDGNPQPDTGLARYTPSTQSSLDLYTQDDLYGKTQFDLERQPDFLASSYVFFGLQWVGSRTTITIGDSESNAYTFVFAPLDPDTDYVFIPHIEENKVKATLHKLDIAGNVLELIYDTYTVIDSNAFKRRKGRFGWYAQLGDGDAVIDSIRDRGFTYAEYRSKPFESMTPVEGAELFVGTSPNDEHFEFFTPGFFNQPDLSLIERDAGRSTSGESWKITDYGLQPFQGLQTNEFVLTNIENTEVQFDLFYPKTALDAGIEPVAMLYALSGSRNVQLLMPEIVPDQWQRIRILLPVDKTYLTGTYRFFVASTGLERVPVTWWVDKPTLFTRTVAWDGRSVIDDPWHSNEAIWTPYKNVLNRDSGGVIFASRGTQLQVRAKGLSQDSSISRVQFKPKYAELGNLVSGSYPTPSAPPGAGFTSSSAGRTASFVSTAADGDGYVAITEWNFGDGGYGVGRTVSHTYDEVGTYTVTQTVTDDNGNKSTTSTLIGV